MTPSLNKSDNSPRNYETQEEFHQALQKQLDKFGITVNQKAKEGQQEPSGNSGEEVYQIRVGVTTADNRPVNRANNTGYNAGLQSGQEPSIGNTERTHVN